MVDVKKKFYVTTPIYYGTANPHLGSLYSTIIADVAARWNKLLGKKVFFLTGTDEHGQKIAEAAYRAGVSPKAFVDNFLEAYKETWKTYNIQYTKFIRTTDDYHIKAVQYWIKYLQEKGDIYKAFYTGWYCTPCETFVSEKNIANGSPACYSCGRSTEQVSEETYFFRLSAYQNKLLDFYKNYGHFIIPKERINEVIKFVEAGLKDLSISRTTVFWGVPFPDDSIHVAYVWADALNNYITAVGYAQTGKEEEFHTWWPADLQVLGKDIVRFHAVYWPAFLMASGLPLPRHLLVHGWIKINDQKMSKSLGNAIDPMILAKQYSVDAIRYYLMRYMAITHDGNFCTEELQHVITSDLAHDLGNLLNRMVILAVKYDTTLVQQPEIWSEASLALQEKSKRLLEEVATYMQEYHIHLAISVIWKFINQINAFFHEQEPWKLAQNQNNKDAFSEVLASTCAGLRVVSVLLWPVMPQKMKELLYSLGHELEIGSDLIENLFDRAWEGNYSLTKIPSLFEQYEPNSRKSSANQIRCPQEDCITIEDVAKVHLVVGTIISCESIDKSDKLLKLKVDFGGKGFRQILAGIKKFYSPVDLVGRQGLFVLNLKPRIMLGHESQGMLLLAPDSNGVFTMLAPNQFVLPGTRLR